MSFESKIKRRKWTEEEKHNTLKACNNRCACCSTKLDMKTLTIEHVVPISKGGENVEENFVVLCKTCNSRKGNKFCWPGGYYMALDNRGKMIVIENYTKDWVRRNIDLEYVKEYPMIAEACSTMLYPENTRPTGKYIPQFIFDIYEITSEGVNSVLKELNLKRKDFMDTLYQDSVFSLVGVKGRTSGRTVALYTVQCVGKEKVNTIFISEVYSSSVKAGMIIPTNLLNYILDTWRDVGISHVLVRNKDSRITKFIFDLFISGGAKTQVDGDYSWGLNVDYDGIESWPVREGHFAFITRRAIISAVKDVKAMMSSGEM